MADYYQLKNQSIFNPPANTNLGTSTNKFGNVFIDDNLNIGNVTVTADTIVTPKVSTITYPGDDTAADPAGGQTITLTGSGFAVGATVLINNVEVGVVSVVSSTSITFTSPANSTGSYVLYVINPDGGTAIAIPGIQYSGTPTWTTAAGSLGNVYETVGFNQSVSATGDAPVTYSIASGTLPPGATFNSNGTITGTSQVLSSPTTYTFTVKATDAELQDTNRTFSLTINPDVVTWVSPANGTTYSSALNSAISNVTLSATSAVGSGITYTANALPTGLSLSGDTISGTPTVEANSSSLLTATANTTSESSNITINWSISVANDPYFEYNTLLIPGASTTFVDDASTNNFAVTIVGDTKPNNFNPYTPGYYSNYFDGAGDWITIPNNAALAFGTGEFTVECWAYITGSSGTVANYTNGQSSNSNFSWEIYQYSATEMWFSVFDGATQYIAKSTAFKTNSWNHIAAVRSGNTLTIYVNGVAGATTVSIAGVSIANLASATLKLCSYGNGSSYVTGYISNFRVVKGTAVYTSNFTPSTTPLTAISGTSLLTCQSNRFIDNSANNFTVTVTGDTKIQSFQPFTPNTSYSTYGSGYFDGTGDYLTYPEIAMGAGQFTAEAWVYLTVSGDGTVISTGRFWFKFNSATSLSLVQGGIADILTASPINSVLNRWAHIAVTRNASNLIQIWVDGVAVGSVTNSVSFGSVAATGKIGIETGSLIQPFTGYITDARLVVGTAVYTSNFTPPSTPLTAIANTSLLTLQNNQSINNNVFLDNSSNNLLVTRNGNATQGTFSPYGGNWSFNCSAASDNTNYLSTPSSANLRVDQGNWTIEFWMYLTAWNTNNRIFDTGSNGDSAAFVIGVSNAGSINFGRPTAGNGVSTANGVIALNTWYHIAMTSEGAGSNGRIYVNGVLQAGPTNYTNPTASSNAFNIGRNNVDAGDWDGLQGYMSNFRFVSGQRLYTSNFTPQTTPLLNNKYSTDGGTTLSAITGTCQLLTLQNGRYVDNSINGFTLTANGSSISTQRFSPFNPSSVTPTSYSAYFDGSGDNLTVASNAAFQLGTGDYTFECWFNPASIASGGINTLLNIGTYITGLFFRCGSGVEVWSNNVQRLAISSSTIISANTWQHAALVRSGSACAVYINGTSVGTFTDSSSISPSTATVMLGMSAHDSSETLTGYMSNARLVKGTAVYTSNFTPPTAPLTAISGTSLLTCQSTTFIDNSTNNFTITANGGTTPSIQNPFGFTSTTTQGYSVSTIGGSAYFDGTGDTLTVPFSSAIDVSTGDFTMEAWCYPTTTTNGIDSIWGSGNYSIMLYHNGTSWTLEVGNGGGNYFTINGTASVYAWHHMAVTRSGSTFNLWIDGVSAGTGTTSGTLKTSGTLTIGGNGNGQNFTGYIADFRIVKGTALYKAKFVPPLAPLTSVQNTTLLTNMTNAGIYDAAMMNSMETVADAKLSTAVTKFGGSSMYFDGTDDGIQIPITPNLYLGTTYTIEAWVYMTGGVTYTNIFSLAESNTGAFAALQIFKNGTTLVASIRTSTSGAETGISGGTLASNTWQHIALSVNAGSAKLFLNGTQVGSTTTFAEYPIAKSLYAAVGRWANGYTASDSKSWMGYMDDFRITKGYARYTGNFTPPTSAFSLY